MRNFRKFDTHQLLETSTRKPCPTLNISDAATYLMRKSIQSLVFKLFPKIIRFTLTCKLSVTLITHEISIELNNRFHFY